MSAVTVRLALPPDYPAVDALVAAAYAHDYGPSDASSADPMRAAAGRALAHDVWIAVDGEGAVLGSVTTRRAGGPPLHEDVADDELDLRLLGVAPAARRSGVAAALMREVAAAATRAGFSAVVLKTAPHMRGAHGLYESLGYERWPARDGLWIGGVRRLELFTYGLPLGAIGAPTGSSARAPWEAGAEADTGR